MDKAHLYAATNSQQIDAAVKFFKIFGDFLKQKFKNKSVTLLDAGSGCGKVLFEISVKKSGLKFSKIIGVDKSYEMLKYAQEVYGNDGRISFYHMDVEGEIPEMLRYQQFDMVSSFYCLHWTQDINNAFQNIYKLLNGNGLFCCVFLLSTKVNDIWDILAEKYSTYMKNWRAYYSPLWSLENAENMLQKSLEECDFKVIKFHDIKNEKFKFRDLENYASKYLYSNFLTYYSNYLKLNLQKCWKLSIHVSIQCQSVSKKSLRKI